MRPSIPRPSSTWPGTPVPARWSARRPGFAGRNPVATASANPAARLPNRSATWKPDSASPRCACLTARARSADTTVAAASAATTTENALAASSATTRPDNARTFATRTAPARHADRTGAERRVHPAARMASNATPTVTAWPKANARHPPPSLCARQATIRSVARPHGASEHQHRRCSTILPNARRTTTRVAKRRSSSRFPPAPAACLKWISRSRCPYLPHSSAYF